MQGNVATGIRLGYNWGQAIPVLRYALGATLILAVAAGSDYFLSYITPVLALTFLAPGVKPLSLKSGFLLVASLAAASAIGVIFSRLFLDFPLVFMPLLALAMFYLYYSDRINPLFRIWLLVSLLLIPLLSSFSYKVGALVAITLVENAAIAVVLVWFIFLVFPYKEALAAAVMKSKPAMVPSITRYRIALKSTIVLLPVLVGFYLYQWSGAILVLVFVAMLSMNPGATSFKSGLLMILSNLAGGIAAIVAFNLFVVVPEFIYLILVTLIAGLVFGTWLFSGKPTAKLYGSAFSTFLLVLGSVTTSEGDAGSKVWSRIIQIGIAVVYVVIAFGLVDHFSKSRNENGR